jgi:hypothetical protein
MRHMPSALIEVAQKLTRRRWLSIALGAGLLTSLSLLGMLRATGTGRLSDKEMAALYQNPVRSPETPLRVFHLGHSLVGRDMPAMLAQLAPAGHGYESQLGWGTTLKAHWEPGMDIAGFETENAHQRFRSAREALGSGDYDAFVMTEMVEIRAAIRYFDSPDYLLRWAQFAREARPNIRLYLYETWHPLDDPEGWLVRLDRDFDRYWDREILRPALSADEAVRPIFVIPVGQVFARFVRRVEEGGSLEDIRRRDDLFARDAAGALDTIHLNDLGNYLVALTHFAVLYHRSPLGLPRELTRADGRPATPPAPFTAQLMQEVVWEIVTGEPMTGVAQAVDTRRTL